MPTPLKRELVRVLRRSGLLRSADTLRYWLCHVQCLATNRRFRREHPTWAVPPTSLTFEALNYARSDVYFEQGRRHGRVFAKLLRGAAAGPIDVLEWGCGPGRLIRHMSELLGGPAARLTGADCDGRCIVWCRENLPRIEFVQSAAEPPLPLASDRFDAVYCFSVFTHLSERRALAWSEELRRVLKPGGLLICTTHGEACRGLLADEAERRRFDGGAVVEQARYAEGRKLYLAVQPERWVRDSLLDGWDQVEKDQGEREHDWLQDIWTARKPLNGRAF